MSGFRQRVSRSGGGTDPDAKFSDDGEVTDDPVFTFKLDDEPGQTGDDFGPWTFRLPDNSEVGDTYTLSNLTLTHIDDCEVDDGTITMDVDALAVWGDAEIDEDNATTNNGTGTTMQTSSGIALVQSQFRGLMKWDLTSLSGWSVVSGSVDIDLTAYYFTPLVEIAFSMGFYRETTLDSSDPWTESTVTWNSRPAHDTQVGQIDFPILAGDGERTLTFDSDLQVDDVLGNWLSIETRMVGLVEVGIFEIAAREHTTQDPPRLNFQVQHTP